MRQLIGDAGLMFYASFASTISSILAVLIFWDILRLMLGEKWRSLFRKRLHIFFRIFIFTKLSSHILLEPIAIT